MTAELIALQEDVESLTGELLNRYEEITRLYEHARELGVVVDLEETSRTALAPSLQIIVFLDAREPEPFVIMLTAAGQESDRRRAIAAGVSEFLTKPFSPSKLSTRLQQLSETAA